MYINGTTIENKRAKNEEKNEDNRFVKRHSLVKCTVSYTKEPYQECECGLLSTTL